MQHVENPIECIKKWLYLYCGVSKVIEYSQYTKPTVYFYINNKQLKLKILPTILSKYETLRDKHAKTCERPVYRKLKGNSERN